jgi:Rrf2 family protein
MQLRNSGYFPRIEAMVLHLLPKAVEYAFKILVCLTLSGNCPQSATAIAKALRIPMTQAAKILHYLTLRGLTRSRRGANGGYLLRVPPGEIRLQRVWELFRPTPEETPSLSPDPLHEVWQEISVQAWKNWAEYTVAELARRTAEQWKTPPVVRPMALD